MKATIEREIVVVVAVVVVVVFVCCCFSFVYCFNLPSNSFGFKS